MNTRKLLFLDFETTGIDPDFHEVIEAGWMLTSPDGKTVISKGDVKVWPAHPERITEAAQKINGYDPEVWAAARALTQQEFAAYIHPMLNDVVLSGQGVNFDEMFLRATLKRFGLTPNWYYQAIDTQKLGWPLFLAGKTPGVSLKHMAPYFGIGEQPAVHRALHDVELTHAVFLKQIELYSKALSA